MSSVAYATFLGMVLYLATPTSAFTEEDQSEVIRAHNFYRSKVQPTATDMVEMVRSVLFQDALSQGDSKLQREGKGGLETDLGVVSIAVRAGISSSAFCFFVRPPSLPPLAGLGHRAGLLGTVLGRELHDRTKREPA